MTDTLTRAKKLFELGGHLGHRKNRLHPRSRQFVYQIIDGVSIIDLEKTIGQIDEATNSLMQAAQEGKKLLVTATKRSLAAQTAALAKDAGAYYITSKWLPGLLTNFNTIQKNVKRLTELKRQKEAGEWGKYVKHEQISLQKEISKLERLYGGVVNMMKLPDIMLVVDIKREKNAITEAKRSGIPVVAIVDTNCNPDDVLFPVMLNDDTPAAVESVMTELLGIYKKHLVQAVIVTPQVTPQVVVAPAEVAAPAPVVKPVEKVEAKVEKKSEPVEVKKAPAKKESPAKKKPAAKTKKSK